jgi:WD40 repeat protein
MNIDISAGTVRVLKRAGATAGAGFLVTSDGLVVTCAHVVHGPRTQDLRPKSVTVQFANGEHREAAVVEEYWRPWDAEDIAVLRVAQPLPQGAVPLPLGSSLGTIGHRFETYGFPSLEAVRALRGYGTVGGRVPRPDRPDYLQLVDSGDITRGFSGAPLWDIHTSRVIGMIDSFPNEDEFGKLKEVTFVTPTESIRTVCPLLRINETCPYRPLQAFTEGDRDLFFGRGDILQTLIPRVTRERFLALLGPSGCGKSSLIRAGLVPKLRSGLPLCEIMVTRPRLDAANDLDQQGLPGAAKDLPGAVLAWCERVKTSGVPARRLVLVFDQFEEVLSPGWGRAGLLLDAIRSILDADMLPVTIVIVMWDAFYSRLLETGPFLAGRLGSAVVNVPPTLSPRELDAMIRGPAQAAGLSVEESLVSLIQTDAAEVDHRGGQGQIHNTVLPLLQLALADLWNHKRDGVLAIEGYRGIRDALADWMNTGLQEFTHYDNQHPDAPLMPYVRRIFIDLVAPGNVEEGIPDARVRRLIKSLYRNDGDERERMALDRVITSLVTARLLMVSRDSDGQEWVEIIHDAVITRWGELQEWLRKTRRLLDWRRSNGDRVNSWTERGRAHSDDALLRGRELAEFEGLIADDSPLLTGEERSFLEASKTAVERAQQEQEAARKRELAQAQALAEAAKAREEEARGREEAERGLREEAEQREKAEAAERLEAERREQAERGLREEAEQREKAERGRRWLAQCLAVAGLLLLGLLAFGIHQRSEARNKDTEAQNQRLRGDLQAESLKGQELELKSQRLDIEKAQAEKKTAEAEKEKANALKDKAEAAEKANLSLAYFSRGLGAEQLRDFPLARVALAKALTLRDAPEFRARLTGTAFAPRLIWQRLLTGAAADTPVTLRAVLITADGKHVVTAGDDHFVHLWAADSGKLECIFDAQSPVLSLALAPRGVVAVGCQDGFVRLLNLGSKQFTRRFRLDHPVRSIAFSEDGVRLAVGLQGNGLRVLDADTGVDLKRVSDGYSAVGVSFGPGGRDVAWVGARYLHMLQVRTGEGGAVVGQQNGNLEAVAWCPGQLVIAAAGRDRTVNLWDFAEAPQPAPFILSTRPASREQVRELVGHTLTVTCLAFSHDGTLLASGGQDGDIRIWDWRAKRLVLTANAPKNNLLGVAFAPDSRRVAAVGSDGRLRLWDLGIEQGVPIYDYTALPEYNAVAAANPRSSNCWVWGLSFLADGELIVELAGHSFHRFDVRTGKRLGTLVEADVLRAVRGGEVRLSPDGRRLAVLDGETVTVSRVGEIDPEHEVTVHDAKSLGWAPDGERLLIGQKDGSVRLVDPKTPGNPPALAAHTGTPIVVAVCRRSQRAALGWPDGTVKVWDFAKGRELAAPPRDGKVAAAAFDAAGRRLAVAVRGGEVRVWDLDRAAVAFVIDRRALCAAFSPDGRWLALGSIQDGTTWLYRANDGAFIGTLEGHTAVVTALAFSPDSNLLISGSEDNTARRWSVPAVERIWTTPASGLLAEAEQQAGLAYEGLDVRPLPLPPQGPDGVPVVATPIQKGDPRALAEDAAAHRNEAEQALDEKDAKRALTTATQASAEADSLLKQGESAVALRLWVSCQVTLGDAMRKNEDDDGALARYRAAVERMTNRFAQSPADIGPEALLAYDRLAEALLAAKHPDEARIVEERAVGLHRVLVERGGDVWEAMILEARYTRLIKKLMDRKRPQDVVERYRELLTVLRGLASRYPPAPNRRLLPTQRFGVAPQVTLIKQGIAVNEERLGDLLTDLDREPEAYKSYSEAVKYRVELLSEMEREDDNLYERFRRTLVLTRFKATLTLYSIVNGATKEDPNLWRELLEHAEATRSLLEAIGEKRSLSNDERQGRDEMNRIIKDARSHLPPEKKGDGKP